MNGLGTKLSERMSPKAGAATTDPVTWIEDKLGERPWSKQREIAEAVVSNRHVAVPSGHGIGKSYIGSRLTAWWIDSHPPGEAFVVTTAPTGPQVEAILWREIGRAHRKGNLTGRITGGAVPAWKIHSEIVAYGRKPQDLQDPEQAAAAFQGIHARFVLVILDEAAGINPWLWDAADSLVTNENSRFLAIGNPTDPASEFAKVCEPGSGWEVIPVSVFDTPAFTGERASRELLELLPSETWVEERKRRWGEDTPLYVAKVLGEFPEESEDRLITPAMVREAQERELPGEGIAKAGVDVARAGSDESVAYVNRGGKARLVHRARGQDTMRTAGAVAKLLKANPQMSAAIDIVGLGAGVYDRLREQGLSVIAFQASEKATQPERFKNRRAESYWWLRELFKAGALDLDPEDEELASQLLSIRWFTDSSGRTQIESKADMKKRGLPSPDRADALAMAIDMPAPKWAGGVHSIPAPYGPLESWLESGLGNAQTVEW
jgi:hypothetical protein